MSSDCQYSTAYLLFSCPQWTTNIPGFLMSNCSALNLTNKKNHWQKNQKKEGGALKGYLPPSSTHFIWLYSDWIDRFNWWNRLQSKQKLTHDLFGSFLFTREKIELNQQFVVDDYIFRENLWSSTSCISLMKRFVNLILYWGLNIHTDVMNIVYLEEKNTNKSNNLYDFEGLVEHSYG